VKDGELIHFAAESDIAYRWKACSPNSKAVIERALWEAVNAEERAALSKQLEEHSRKNNLPSLIGRL